MEKDEREVKSIEYWGSERDKGEIYMHTCACTCIHVRAHVHVHVQRREMQVIPDHKI